MTNSYYNHGSYPVTGAPGASAALRAELDLVTAGFALLPTLSGNANKALVINAGGSAVTVTTGTLALAGNFATTGAFNTTLVQGATTSLTLPLVSGTLATLAGTETLSNKTIAASTLSGTVSGGGNQINNVIIGTSTPLAGTFTTLTSTSALITTATTDAISITTGALQSAGGLGVTKALWVGGLANIAGVTTLGAGAVLNTPASMTATNITGTAAGLTAGNVTTNANLTGDVTSVGNATTLATVASAGSTGSSTAIPVVTINAKGLTTGITTAAVIAPAGTLTGATLAANVLASSLTSLGTIAALTATAGTITTTPSASTDIANKLYVDTVAQGLDAKASCIAATTANITLSGTQTVDGVVLIAADRVLVKNQTTSADNGLYLCAAGAWTRTTDADTWDELRSAFVFIERGTTYADTGWTCTIDSGGTLGTTAVTWAQFSGAGSYTASTGLTLTGTAFSLTAPVTVALGGTNATTAGIAAFNNITGYTASGATGTTSTNLVFSASPTLTGTLTAAAGTFSGLITASAGVNSTLTTDATSTTTGSIITAGGISTQKALFVGTTSNFAGAITYGGITLSNSVTGTGSMVLATSPTITSPVLSGTMSGGTFTGTFSGALSGTISGSATLSGNTTMSGTNPLIIGAADTGAHYQKFTNNGGNAFVGVDSSAGGVLLPSSPYDLCILTESAQDVVFGTTNTERMRIGAAGGVIIGSPTGGNQGAGTLNATAVYDDGVAIPTISSTSTLTNKTLAAPTITGTALFTGTTVDQRSYDSDAATNEKYWWNYADAGVYSFRIVNDAFNADTVIYSIDRSSYTAATFTFNVGVVGTGATGGDKGVGTSNWTAVYDDGTLLTCYVLEVAVTGSVDMAKWDKLVPNRVIPAVTKTVDDTDAEPDADGVYPTKLVEVEPEVIEERFHTDARKFVSRLGTDSDPLDIDKYAAHWKAKRHLTSMPNKDKFDVDRNMATGSWIQRLVETVEIQAVHIENLNQRLKAAGL